MIETILKIDGMMCGMCESHINQVIRKDFDVKSVKSSHRKGITTIFSENPLDQAELEKAIAATGYRLEGMDSHPAAGKKLFSFH